MVIRTRFLVLVLGCPGTKTDHRHKLEYPNILIGVRIKNDICIRVRVTGIRVRITSRVRIAKVVLGCSGHYIDPNSFFHL